MTMRLSDTVINAAFECHATRYARDKLWSIPYHIKCWEYARDAFDGGSEEAFGNLYDELRKRWQVFRSQNYNAQTAEIIQQIMSALPVELRNRRLSEFADPTPAMLDQLWCAITTAAQSIFTLFTGPAGARRDCRFGHDTPWGSRVVRSLGWADWLWVMGRGPGSV